MLFWVGCLHLTAEHLISHWTIHFKFFKKKKVRIKSCWMGIVAKMNIMRDKRTGLWINSWFLSFLLSYIDFRVTSYSMQALENYTILEMSCKKVEKGKKLSSVNMKREGYRETYPLSATACWEGTQTVLKGAQGRRGASTRAATWDITALYRAENFLFSGKWNTETEVQRVCWTFILGDAQSVLCMALSNLIRWDSGWSAGWRWPLQVPSNSYDSLVSSCHLFQWCQISSVLLSHPLLSSRWSRHGRQSNNK